MKFEKKHIIILSIIILLLAFVIYRKSKKWTFVIPQKLRNDPTGKGHFGASRGSRTHKGVDLLVKKGQPVLMPFDGEVLREVRPYASDNRLNGLEIQNETGDIKVKIFYIRPRVGVVGQKMKKGQLIAIAQDVRVHYPNSPEMLPHIHIEKWVNGTQTDPTGDLRL